MESVAAAAFERWSFLALNFIWIIFVSVNMTAYSRWLFKWGRSLQIIIISIYLMRPLIVNTFLRRVATMSSDYISGTHSMAFVTAPNEEVAKKLAHGLVQNKLAACVNIIPKITSVYEWEGKIEEDSELLLMLKTRTSRVPDVTKFVKENHPYDVAEVISSPIEQGNPAYLKWISENVPSINEAKQLKTSNDNS